MKKAYLITSYNQPKHLGRLVRTLQCKDVSFFIHVDKKANIAPFLEAVGSRKNVTFIRNRIKVNWMGFSQVSSILELMKEAAQFDFDYYTLLSGSDYPIKNNNYILSFFEHSKSDYIVYWKLEDRPSWLHKIEYYYFIDTIPIMDYQGALFQRYYWGYFYKFKRFMPKRRYLENMIPYGGSDWWSLSNESIKFILNYVSNNNKYVRFYKYTHCPSEMFFHTIILNSKLANKTQNFIRYNEWSSQTSKEDKLKGYKMLPEDSFNYRYIDWNGERTEGLGSPAILDERDFEALKNSQCLFARKFDEHRSKTLLDLIDSQLLLNK